MVWFIYRDEVYNTDTKDKSEAEIIIAKNRGGETRTAKLSWQGEITKFNAKAEDVFQIFLTQLKIRRTHEVSKSYPSSLISYLDSKDFS